MCPYIHIFSFDLPVYGLMMLLGMAVSMGIVFLMCKPHNYPRQEALLAALIAFAGGIAGSILIRPLIRLPDVIINWGKYSQLPLGEFFSWFIGEFVFYGGLIGGAFAVILYCRHFKMSVFHISDVFAPALPVGHAVGRLGCLLAGCCYGIEVSPSNPFAITYPVRTDGMDAFAAPAGVPLLATPLIEASGNIIIALIVILSQRKSKISGFGIGMYGMLYSIQRFILEFFRGDLQRGVYGGISTSQIISIIIFAISLVWLLFVYLRSRKTKKELS